MLWANARGTRQVDDRLLAAALIVQHPVKNDWFQRLKVESVEDGWWYTAALPDQRELVAFMTDASTLKTRRIRGVDSFLEIARETEHIRECLVDAVPVGKVLIRPAYSGLVHPVVGKNWVAVGDAVASFDPLSSIGIGHALHSGIQGARVANSVLSGHSGVLEEYAAGGARNFIQYKDVRRLFYLRERRWPKAPFWYARHEAMSAHRGRLPLVTTIGNRDNQQFRL